MSKENLHNYMTPAERAVDEVERHEKRNFFRKEKAKEIGFKAMVGAGLVTAVLAGLGGTDKESPDLPVSHDNAVERIAPMTDNEINQMVYKLYGLNKDEVAIVEESLK